MRTAIGTILLCLLVSFARGQTIPAGTLLPVMLDDTVESDKSKPGEEVSAKLYQQVVLPEGLKIKRLSKVVGHVVAVTPPSGSTPASITVQFDQVEIGKKSVTVSTGLRALASMRLVAQVRNPVNMNAGPGTTSWDLNVSQIGGQIAYNGARIVKAPNGQVVGRVVEPGAIVGVPMANPGAGCAGPAANVGEQAFWVFSTDACGLYDEEELTYTSGIGGPNSGKIVLKSAKHFDVRSGSAWLLQVN
ncbi:MAG TPA: hypothetical protein VFB24_15460 [Candidatus Binatia bacterium]|nr:hypothetical protein [Candidatus Binatia bacterium]